MEYYFKYSLTESDTEIVYKYLHSAGLVVVEQHPEWPKVINDTRRYCYFMATENGAMKCFAQISEQKNPLLKIADLHFGPVCQDPSLIIECVQRIYNYYKEVNFASLTVLLAFPTGANSDYIEYKLNTSLKIKYHFDRYNWSSISINLSKPIDEIFKNFSKGHKSDIRRAEKNGLTVKKMPLSDEELCEFGMVYTKMNRFRNLPVNENEVIHLFKNLDSFFNREKIGNFYLVKESSGQVVGGIIVLIQGKSVRYYKGASDPDKRDLPVSHLALWEAIKDAHDNSYEIFDFWGYNHLVDEKDQVFYINKFKKGFGGEFSFYPKIMYFIYKPALIRLYHLLSKLKNLIRNNA